MKTALSRIKHFGGSSSLAGKILQQRSVFLTLVVLWIETLWFVFWPCLVMLIIFVAISLAGMIPQSPWLHSLGLAGLALGGLGTLFYQGMRVRQYGIPNRDKARRYLDQASGLAHRPISSLADHPSVPSGQGILARQIWQRHRARLTATLEAIPPLYPHLSSLEHIKRGRRVFLSCLVLLGIIIAYEGEAPFGERLMRAFQPEFSSLDVSNLSGVAAPSLDVWVDPPAYTGLSPVILAASDETLRLDASSSPLKTPVGSRILIRAFGPMMNQTVSDSSEVVARLGEVTHPLTVSSVNTGQATLAYSGEKSLSIEGDGEILANWVLEAIPDSPPRIMIPHPPREGRRLALRLEYEADDDYGVDRVWADIALAGNASETVSGDPLTIPLSRSSQPRVAGVSYRDLTSHPWAGEAVDIHFKAQDALGQIALSPPASLKLPERVFTHPLARQIILYRKQLLQKSATRATISENLKEVADQLQNTAPDASKEIKKRNRLVFLGLRQAATRLTRSEDMSSVSRLLWDLALRLEDGVLGEAEHELRLAQELLEKALAENASSEEINQLTERLRRALREFLTAWQERWADSERNPLDMMPPSADVVTPESLEDMIDQMQDMMQLGAREAAKELLSQLRETLENIDSPGQGEQTETGREIARALDHLGNISREQQALLDRSFEGQRQQNSQQNAQESAQGNAQRNMPSSPPLSGNRQQAPQPGSDQEMAGKIGRPSGQEDSSGSGSGLAGSGNEWRQEAVRQDNLRRQLGDLMLDFDSHLGQIPDALGEAELAMQEAAQALGRLSPADALDPQSQALKALREAENSIAGNLGQNALTQSGQGGRIRPGKGAYDPFGRRQGNGGQMSGSVDGTIPGEATMGRAREILQELRRRSGESGRSQIDRAYIKRLLPGFSSEQ